MNSEKIVNYKDIGDVLYRKTSRAKNMAIRINSNAEIRVTLPSYGSFRKAEQFFNSKEAWVRSKLASMEQRVQQTKNFSAGDLLQGLFGKIELIAGSSNEFSVMKVNENYIVELPEDYSNTSRELRDALMQVLEYIGLDEGKSVLPKMMDRLSVQHRLDFSRVTVRKMKTRWGSCSSSNRISLNSALVFLPEKLAEYVILHELAHTVH